MKVVGCVCSVAWTLITKSDVCSSDARTEASDDWLKECHELSDTINIWDTLPKEPYRRSTHTNS
jgi:hypothetical protein